MELSKSTWLVTSLAPGSEKMSSQSVIGGDIAGIFARFADLRGKTQARTDNLPVGGDPGSRFRRVLAPSGYRS
jgi:transposase